MKRFSLQDLLLIVLWTVVLAKNIEGREPCLIKTFGTHQSGDSLINHVIRTTSVTSWKMCEMQCFLELGCESYNYGVSENGSHLCELSDSDAIRDPLDLTARQGFVYCGTKNPCVTARCPINSRCYWDFEHDTYKCVCHPGFTGGNCNVENRENYDGLYKSGKNTSGIYIVYPNNTSPIEVFCDQTTDGGGWTVFQKRLDGSVDFFRGWQDYRRGFGLLSGEFWLGLDKIHNLTKTGQNKLRVDLEDFEGNNAYAEYDMFVVESGETNFTLRIGSYSGTAGDSLLYHNGSLFTTKDQDYDKFADTNCAQLFKGAWWYRDCHYSNLNGLYYYGFHSSFADGVNWTHWKGFYYSVKRAEMKMKPINY